METQWWETVTSMQAGFLWEDFWNHGSDGYATVLLQLQFISIKKGLLNRCTTQVRHCAAASVWKRCNREGAPSGCHPSCTPKQSAATQKFKGTTHTVAREDKSTR